MALSIPITGDILDAWREYVFEDIWRFNQVVGDGIFDIPAGDGGTSEQQAYLQKDRELVGRALYIAYEKLRSYLNYTVTPQWFTAEDHHVRLDEDVHYQQFATRNGYLIEFGKRTASLIEAGATVTYSATNTLIGIDDTASVTVTTDVADDEIGLFFTVADGGNQAVTDTYRVLPVDVTDNGDGTKTITAHRALFVNPRLFWARPYTNAQFLEPNYAVSTNASDFVTSVDVYRVYADASQAVELYTRRHCSNCTDRITYMQANINDSRLGLFKVCDTSDNDRCNYGYRLRVHYRAGFPLQNGRIDAELGEALTRLANAQMSLAPGALADAAGVWAEDRFNEEQTTQLANDLGAVFGIKRGQIAAARIVKHRAVASGGLFSANNP